MQKGDVLKSKLYPIAVELLEVRPMRMNEPGYAPGAVFVEGKPVCLGVRHEKLRVRAIVNNCVGDTLAEIAEDEARIEDALVGSFEREVRHEIRSMFGTSLVLMTDNERVVMALDKLQERILARTEARR